MTTAPPPPREERGRGFSDQPPSVGASVEPESVPPSLPEDEPESVPPSVPPSLVPPSVVVVPLSAALHSMTGSEGSAGIGPQVSPFTKHSAADAQSWIGPIGVDGHGPAWQVVIWLMLPQQISPVAHPAALVQVTPAGASVWEPEDEPDEPVSSSGPLSTVALFDELLHPEASASPIEPALSRDTKRIFEFCIGNVPPPNEVGGDPTLDPADKAVSR